MLFRLREDVVPDSQYPWLVHGIYYPAWICPGPTHVDGSYHILLGHPTKVGLRTGPLANEFFEGPYSEDNCEDWDAVRGYLGPEPPG